MTEELPEPCGHPTSVWWRHKDGKYDYLECCRCKAVLQITPATDFIERFNMSVAFKIEF